MLLMSLLLTASAAPPPQAAHWEFGVGVVNDIGEADLLGIMDGGRIHVRRVRADWAYEVQLYGSAENGRYPALAAELVAALSGAEDASYVMPVVQDMASLSALVEWRGLPSASGDRAGFRLYGGLELRAQRVWVLRDEDGPVLSEEVSRRRVGGAVFGAGWHVQRELLGARLALYDHICPSVSSYPMASDELLIETPGWLSHEPTLALDVVFRL